MTDTDRIQLVRDTYGAYETGERHVVEAALSDDFEFFSPADVGIDRDVYFERCWPNSERIASFEFKRLFEHGDEVVVTYESETKDGKRFRNTEIVASTATGSAASRSTSAGTSSDAPPARAAPAVPRQ